MEIKRLKTGQILLNKLNGGLYEVTEVKTEMTVNSRKSRIGTAVRIMEDQTLDLSDWVTVTEENALCFRIMKDVKPEVPEGYLLKDGILTLDGNSIEQGEIVVEQILAATNGNLLLIARKTGEETGSLYRYETERDRFRFLCSRGEQASPIWTVDSEDGCCTVLGWKEYRTEIKEDEQGNPIRKADGDPETETRFDETVLVTLCRGDVAICSKNVELEAPVSEICNPKGYSFVSLTPDGVPFLLFLNRGGYLIIQRTGIQDFVRASKAHFHGCTETSFLFVGTDVLRFSGTESMDVTEIRAKDIARQTEDYDTLIDIQNDADELVFVLADDSYHIKTVRARKTRDRGYIVKID